MLESECLACFYDAGEATVFAGGNDFAGVEADWRSAVWAPNFIDYSHVDSSSKRNLMFSVV